MRLAEEIASELFVNGFGERADRLELKAGDLWRDKERSLGGLSFKATVDRIEKIIEASKQTR